MGFVGQPDLSGLQSEYGVRPGTGIRRLWVVVVALLLILQSEYGVRPGTGIRRLWVVVVALLLILQIVRIVRDPSGFTVALTVLMCLAYGLSSFAYFVRPPAVFLRSDGVVVRRFLRNAPLIPWRDVEEIQVQTRWQDHSSVVTRGRAVPLPGVPREDAQRLADALESSRAG